MSQCAQGNADRVGRRLRAYRLTRGEKTGMNTAQVHAVSRSGGGVPHETLVCSQEPPRATASAGGVANVPSVGQTYVARHNSGITRACVSPSLQEAAAAAGRRIAELGLGAHR